MCYWTSWASTTSNSNPSLCTHISYAFIDVDSNGNLYNTGGLATFKTLKNTNPNAKLLISIGGANYGPWSTFSNIAASSTLRQTFANNIFNFLQSNNLNGGNHKTLKNL